MMEISDLRHSTVLYVYSEKESIEINPDYQRLGDIWTLEKRQLLIDSIINGFDIPKIYFHKFSNPQKKDDTTYRYAIVDGKQRLESIWQFIEGEFPLSSDFEYMRDTSVKLAGLTYKELGRRYPNLKLQFDSFPLSIVTIETDDIDLIEDMFSRLNEAVPLSAAEKRNALGGTMPLAIRNLARTKFFTSCLPFGNNRYRHYDLSVKCLMIEHEDRVVDTKKVYLDNFVKNWKEKKRGEPKKIINSSKSILKEMIRIFSSNDPLLRSVANVVLFYHVFRIAKKNDWLPELYRDKIMAFEVMCKENRVIAEDDIAKADYDLLEFDRYIQTPNDSYAIEFRIKVFIQHVLGEEWEPN